MTDIERNKIRELYRRGWSASGLARQFPHLDFHDIAKVVGVKIDARLVSCATGGNLQPCGTPAANNQERPPAVKLEALAKGGAS